jgi:hypothetical protein
LLELFQSDELAAWLILPYLLLLKHLLPNRMTSGNALVLYDLQMSSSNLPPLLTEIVSRLSALPPRKCKEGDFKFATTVRNMLNEVDLNAFSNFFFVPRLNRSGAIVRPSEPQF